MRPFLTLATLLVSSMVLAQSDKNPVVYINQEFPGIGRMAF